MPKIHLLPDSLIGRIAAGEVVERPASVVKELLENALDAGATEVRIELGGGGKRRILVEDNGSGMDRDDALLAFDRHATSKIENFEDLERVSTLGFRGEALSTIAAVARVELVTAREVGNGHRVRIEGGQVKSVQPVAHSRGTRIEISSLFFNVPARRKFLKTPQTELRRSLEVVQGYALAHPQLRFSLWHEGKSVLDVLPAEGTAEGIQERISQIFSEALAGSLVPFGLNEGSVRSSIWGLVGDPSTARGRRYFIYVNRRLVRDRAILATFYRAVRDEWRSDEFPALFMFLDIDPLDVDVNVHPQKSEVRFRDSHLLGQVSRTLRQGLRDALGDSPAPGGELLSSGARLPWEPVHGGFGETGGSGVTGVSGSIRASGVHGWQPGEVGEARSHFEGAHLGRLPEAVYSPLSRSPIKLSGKRGHEKFVRLIGQYKGTLLLIEAPDGLLLIDQHVAHERILYEQLRREMEGKPESSQRFVQPLLLQLAPAEALRLDELAAELKSCGFELARMSGNSYGVMAAPAALSADEAEKTLLDLTHHRTDSTEQPATVRDRLLDTWAANQSCRSAVKMHHPLTPEEMEELIRDLFRAEQPFACPHGRPIVLKMSDADLESKFGRR